MTSRWIRTQEAVASSEAIAEIDRGTPWNILWCEGGVSRSSAVPLDTDGIDYARRHLIDPSKRERLFRKARRKGRTKSVVLAERWEHADTGPLILFYASGPYLLPPRDEPTAR